MDPNQGEALVEVTLPSKGAATRLQLEAETYGIDFNEHYLRRNSNGTVTATVFGTGDELRALEDAGFELGTTIEGPETWRERAADRAVDVRQENRADAAALDQPVAPSSHQNELVVLRADFFENYAGRFLSVEAKTRLGGSTPTGATYTGPSLSLSYNSGPGAPIDSAPVAMDVNIDPDTSPDTYIEHRELVRVGDVGGTQRPTRIRIGSSTGSTLEAPVEVWLGGGLPPMKDGYLSDFTTRYLDPTEVYQRFDELAAEFSNLAELITLPHKTNGYQRRAQALMAGTTDPDVALPGGSSAAADARAQPRRSAHLARMGPRGRQRHLRRVRDPAGRERAAARDGDRQPHLGQPGDGRRRRAVEHGRGGGARDQLEPRRTAARRGAHVSRQRRRRHRPAARAGEPVRLPGSAARACSAGRSSTR